MKIIDDIGFGGWLILFCCFAVTYCLLLIIFKPFDYDWKYVWIGIIIGTFDLICVLFIYIGDIVNRQKELDKKEKQETWIDRVCEKGFK